MFAAAVKLNGSARTTAALARYGKNTMQLNIERQRANRNDDGYVWDDTLDDFFHIKVSIEKVGPKVATRMIKQSEASGFENRKIRGTRIERYSAEMIAGRWGFTAEPVILGERGEIFNGQHRLLAIVHSGATVPLLIVRGVDRTAFDAIDSGLGRKASDVLGASGYEHRVCLAAAARWLWRYENGGILNATPVHTFSNQVAVDVVKANPGLHASVMRVQCDGLKSLAPASPLAFCHYIFSRIDKGDAEKFFNDLERGEGLTSADPVWHLRQRMISDRSGYSKIRPEHLVILIFKTWNAMRSGSQMGRLSIGRVISNENVPTLI
jgi:hypothetical protein